MVFESQEVVVIEETLVEELFVEEWFVEEWLVEEGLVEEWLVGEWLVEEDQDVAEEVQIGSAEDSVWQVLNYPAAVRSN